MKVENLQPITKYELANEGKGLLTLPDNLFDRRFRTLALYEVAHLEYKKASDFIASLGKVSSPVALTRADYHRQTPFEVLSFVEILLVNPKTGSFGAVFAAKNKIRTAFSKSSDDEEASISSIQFLNRDHYWARDLIKESGFRPNEETSTQDIVADESITPRIRNRFEKLHQLGIYTETSVITDNQGNDYAVPNVFFTPSLSELAANIERVYPDRCQLTWNGILNYRSYLETWKRGKQPIALTSTRYLAHDLGKYHGFALNSEAIHDYKTEVARFGLRTGNGNKHLAKYIDIIDFTFRDLCFGVKYPVTLDTTKYKRSYDNRAVHNRRVLDILSESASDDSNLRKFAESIAHVKGVRIEPSEAKKLQPFIATILDEIREMRSHFI